MPLSDLTIHEEIGRGAHSVVSRGTRGGQEYAVKYYKGPKPLEKSAHLFRREAALHASLRHEAITRIFEVGHDGTSPYIISEFVRGSTLSELLEKGPLSITSAVLLTKTLASALEVVHQYGLVHRDITPRNILVTNDGVIKLIDFGLVSRRQAEDEAQQAAVGTFQYSAPEQTGMLERPVDGRADLYALGNILFACIVGHPPFESNELGDLLHQHAAKAAPRVDSLVPTCHHALADIVEKLLCKDPDDRFQSGRSLLDALQALPIVLSEETDPFGRPSFQNKGEQRLNLQTFVGREKECKKLGRLWRSVQQKGQSVIFEGAPGGGKSRLVEQFIHQYVPQQTLLLRGKCVDSDPYPFAPIREALQTYLSELEENGKHDKELALQTMREAAGELGGLLQLLGPQVTEALQVKESLSEQQDARELFYNALATFLLRFADLSQGAILWIDDVQWLDEASREALLQVASNLPSHKLLLLFTSRNDSASQPALEQIHKHFGPYHLHRYTLNPLTEEETHELLRSELGGGMDLSFLQQISQRSQGSPLVVWQYLRAMKDAGILVPYWNSWVVEFGEMGSMKLPDDLYDILTSRLDYLDQESRRILAISSFLGNQISFDQIRAVCRETSLEDIQYALTQGLENQLIERSSHDEDYTFVHDRIRETLRSSFDGDKIQLHHRAALYLNTLSELSGRQLFERAQHFLQSDEDDFSLVFQAVLEAAKRANVEHAYTEAYSMLSRLTEPPPAANIPKADMLLYYQTFGAACYQTDNVDEADRHYQKALELSEDPLERALIHAHIARATIFTFDTKTGIKELEAAFSELDQELLSTQYKDPIELQQQLLLLMKNSLVEIESGEKAGSAKGRERELYRVIINLCDTGFLVGYYDRNRLLSLQFGLLSLLPSHYLGESLESCRGYGTFVFLMGLLGKHEAVERFGVQAQKIAKKLGDRQTLAQTQSLYALGLHLGGRVQRALEYQQEVFEKYANWLGPVAFQNCCVDLSWSYAVRGLASEELRVSQAAIKRLETKESTFMAGYICRASGSAMAAAAMLGRMDLASYYYQEVCRFESIVPPDRTVPWVSIAGFLVQYFYQQGEFGEELEAAIERHRAWKIPPESGSHHSKHFYTYQGYARLEMLHQATSMHFPKRLEDLKDAVAELEIVAKVPTQRNHLLVLQANVHIFQYSFDQAWSLLDQARAQSYECDNPWALFEEARSRAYLLKMQDKEFGSQQEAQRAHQIARQYKWRPRMRVLERQFPGAFQSMGYNLREQTKAYESKTEGFHPTYSPATDVSENDSSHLRRQLDALLALSRASASVLDADEQIGIALNESMRILGAERAFFFLVSEDEQQLEFKLGRTAEEHTLTQPTDYSQTIVDKAYDSRQAFVLSTRADAEAIEAQSVVAYDLRSVLAAPLFFGDQILGVIYLDNRLARGMFNEKDVELLLAMGNYIATAVHTARTAQLQVQLRAEQERRKLAETLRELNISLTSTLNLREGLMRLLDALKQEVSFERSAAVLLENGVFEPAVSDNWEAEELSQFIKQASVTARLHHLNRAQISLEPLRIRRQTEHTVTLSIPLRSRENLVGAVLLMRNTKQVFLSDEVDWLRTLVEQANIAIDNARLFHQVKVMAELDELTGLYNRREFFRRADDSFLYARDSGKPLAAIMFDVDHFKQFNDTYGHVIGDEVLRHIAKLSRDAIREGDILGRYGGEEFAVLLPGAHQEAAEEVGERLRRSMEEHPLKTEEHGELTVTISLGVTSLHTDDNLSVLLSRADQALYRSKHKGRNTITYL